MREVKQQPKSFADRVDSVISVIAPKWAAKRAFARLAIEQCRTLGRIQNKAFRGADNDRMRSDWLTSDGSADADILPELDSLRERSRDLVRNDGTAASIMLAHESNIIGTGFRRQSLIDGESLGWDESRIAAEQRNAERAFRRWSKRADVSDRMSFSALQKLWVRQRKENGAALAVIRHKTRSGVRYSTCIQIIEVDRLQTPSGADAQKLAGGREIRGGVEIGADGEPVAYWILTRHPGDSRLGLAGKREFKRIPARDERGRRIVLHGYDVLRPGMSTGYPSFAPTLPLMKDSADYREAEVVAARVGACNAMMIERQLNLDDQFNFSPTESTRIETMEPGMVAYLNPGEKVQGFNPNRPNANFGPFQENLVRTIAAATGRTYEQVSMDFSKVNYSSARAAMLEVRRLDRMQQQLHAEEFADAIYEHVLEEAFLLGEFAIGLSAESYYANAEALLAGRWIANGWDWVDPKSEIEAATNALTSNLTTLAEEAASRGQDWEEMLAQRAREIKRARELGLDQIAQPGAQQQNVNGGVAA